MRVLVTNDDGIEARGIHALADRLAEDFAVTVAAPAREQSASGHSITLHRPVRVRPYAWPGVRAFAVEGTPVDAVKLAVEALMPEPPDVVVSGINHGSNLGRDVFYSGTVAAAIEGFLLGVPAVAVSLEAPDGPGFDWGAAFVAWWLATRFSPPEPGTLWNINLPRVGPRVPTGMLTVPLGRREYVNTLSREPHPGGGESFRIAGQVAQYHGGPDTDVGAVAHGYVAVTPLQLDITAWERIPRPPVAVPIPPEALRIRRSAGATLDDEGGVHRG
ncbi:MAG: 5'/3'-nucleotidase SurE [Actinomycetia bacterium]|nr:5'/3'-nucleotidase SurE [Actinomycetes bacterium]